MDESLSHIPERFPEEAQQYRGEERDETSTITRGVSLGDIDGVPRNHEIIRLFALEERDQMKFARGRGSED